MKKLGFFGIGILVILVTIPDVFAESASPLKQLKMGIALEDIICNDDKILLISPNDKPACLTFDSANRLMDRGYIKVILQTQVQQSFEIKLQEISDSETLGIQDSIIIEKSQTLKNLESRVIANHTTSQPLLNPAQKTIMNNQDPCSDLGTFEHPYVMVTPTSYSITSGQFEKLCVQPHYKWFDIYLDTNTKGSLTLEIPKSQVDLKQYDYLDCHVGARYSALDDKPYLTEISRKITVEQIAQTDQTRTLKFTYDEPFSHINYFGIYAILDDGRDLSGPDLCITEYEEGNFDPDKRLPRNEPQPDPPQPPCQRPIDLNYTITNANLDAICGGGPVNRNYDYKRVNIAFNLSDVKPNAELIVDVPWTELRPYKWLDLDSPDFYPGKNSTTICNPPPILLFRNYEYQTFKIPLTEGMTSFGIGWTDRSEGRQPFSELAKFIRNFDRSDDSHTINCYHYDTHTSTFHYPNGTQKQSPLINTNMSWVEYLYGKEFISPYLYHD